MKIFVVAMILLLAIPLSAHAQGSGAINMIFNTSARAAGVGRCGGHRRDVFLIRLPALVGDMALTYC